MGRIWTESMRAEAREQWRTGYSISYIARKMQAGSETIRRVVLAPDASYSLGEGKARAKQMETRFLAQRLKPPKSQEASLVPCGWCGALLYRTSGRRAVRASFCGQEHLRELRCHIKNVGLDGLRPRLVEKLSIACRLRGSTKHSIRLAARTIGATEREYQAALRESGWLDIQSLQTLEVPK